MKRAKDIYGGEDPRFLPFYGLREAALCLRLPVATLRQWTVGREYEIKSGRKVFLPLIRPADPERNLLSFVNLLEGQALRAFRREHNLRFKVIREALTSLKTLDGPYAKEHPLAFEDFLTDGLDIFVERVGDLITLNPARQIAIRAAFRNHLQRIRRDATGPTAFFPWVEGEGETTTPVTIDPRVAFGRPVLTGTGIATAVIASFVRAGERIKDIAEDYDLSPEQVEAAVTFEEAA
ncbi:MAG: DUF433 domain-containing protein [Thermoanaerobaculia bacterium]